MNDLTEEKILEFFEGSYFTGVIYGNSGEIKVFSFEDGGYEGYVESSYKDLRTEVEALEANKVSLQAKVRELEKKKKDVEKAIQLLLQEASGGSQGERDG